jgi:adenylate kinase family enzyme
VLIVGAGGAGKSTLARELARATGLPVTHLDERYWSPGWVPTPDDEWRERIRDLTAADRWILDGNYSATLDLRMERADTLVLLDRPRVACLWGTVRRVLTRTDGRLQAPGCPSKLNAEFVNWVWTYPKRSRPKVLAAVDSHPEIRFVRLRSRAGARQFLRSASAAPQ